MGVKDRSTARPRGRPARISREEIVAAAIEIGLDRFTLDEISEGLGVTTPALYKHVDGRDDILRSAASTVIEGLEPDLASIDRWDEWLRAWAAEIRLRVGGVGENVLEAVRGSVEASTLRVADHGLRLLTDAGLTPAEAGYALWLTFRTACTAGPANRSSIAEPMAHAAGTRVTSAEMTEAIDAITDAGGQETWRFDLDVIISGIAARCR